MQSGCMRGIFNKHKSCKKYNCSFVLSFLSHSLEMAESGAGDDERDEGERVAEEVDVELVVLGREEAGRVVGNVVGIHHQMAAHRVVGLTAPHTVRAAVARCIL